MNPKLIIITDRGSLKAYRLETTPKGTPRLELLEETTIEDAHHRLVEKVTDLSGRRASPTAKKWGTPLSDDHNLELEIDRRLIREIAGHIRLLVNAHRELPCCLAAPKEILLMLLEALPAKVRARIETNLAQDLVKVPRKELLKIFAPPTANKLPMRKKSIRSAESTATAATID